MISAFIAAWKERQTTVDEQINMYRGVGAEEGLQETRQSGFSAFFSAVEAGFFFIDVRRIRLRLRLRPFSVFSSNSFFFSRSLTLRLKIGLSCRAADNWTRLSSLRKTSMIDARSSAVHSANRQCNGPNSLSMLRTCCSFTSRTTVRSVLFPTTTMGISA